MHVEALATTKNDVRPLTGAAYLDRARDSREIYIYGARVEDVTAHPALRNSCRMVARLHDAPHAPETRETLTCPTDTGNGGFTRKFFRVDRSAAETRQTRDAIAQWARTTCGWMGRSPMPGRRFVPQAAEIA